MGPKPLSIHARLRKKSDKPGNLLQLQKRLWWGILQVEDILEHDQITTDQQLKALSTLAQLTGVYSKLLRDTDVELRLTALEQRRVG